MQRGGGPVRFMMCSAPTLYTISLDIPGSLSERRSFHYFQSQKMAEMPGNFEPYFWNNLVLQFSHDHATIRQSLIALSALYEHRGEPREGIGATNAYVLQHYNKAVSCLVEYLASRNQDARVILISCLLFIGIEFLQDNLDSGFHHLESGLKILRDLRRTCNPIDFDNDDIYGPLYRSFRRLRIQAVIHSSNPTRISNLPSDGLELGNPIPSSFSNVFEARRCLDDELDSIFDYTRQLRDADNYKSIDMQAVNTFRLACLERLGQWDLATKAMLDNNIQQSGSTRAPLIRLYSVTVNLILKIGFEGNQMVFDKYTPEFEQMIIYAEKLIQSSELNKSQLLSFDMGVLLPLCFLIVKCRVLKIRRRALELLKLSPEREGMWQRASIVKYCEWKVELEESGRGDLPESALLPESVRIWQEEIPTDIDDKSVTQYIRFRRGMADTCTVKVPDDWDSVLGMANMV
ncbi:hypothetical protein B7494_g484 [Chlorociboria aeruginascens]|nr:hypothetical protein B7494_g484 [Chlorociboria aeruginascens]